MQNELDVCDGYWSEAIGKDQQHRAWKRYEILEPRLPCI